VDFLVPQNDKTMELGLFNYQSGVCLVKFFGDVGVLEKKYFKKQSF
jgi:hypothetical protein